MGWQLISKRKQPVTSPTYLRLVTSEMSGNFFTTELELRTRKLTQRIGTATTLSEAIELHMKNAKRFGLAMHTESLIE